MNLTTNLINNTCVTEFENLAKDLRLDQIETSLWKNTLIGQYAKKEIDKQLAEKFLKENRQLLIKIANIYHAKHATNC